jgi:hypothetical protein
MSKKISSNTKSNSQLATTMKTLFNYLDTKVNSLNASKVFAGLMIIILNISSKFVTIKLSKTMEGYLKYTFSRDILIFAICWVGSRDIYVAIILTFIFIFMIDYILNEDSSLCCLSKGFKDYHISLVEGNTTITEEEIRKAKEILQKAETQQEGMQNITNSDNKNTSVNPASINANNSANTARPGLKSSFIQSGNTPSQYTMPNLT